MSSQRYCVNNPFASIRTPCRVEEGACERWLGDSAAFTGTASGDVHVDVDRRRFRSELAT